MKKPGESEAGRGLPSPPIGVQLTKANAALDATLRQAGGTPTPRHQLPRYRPFGTALVA